MIMADSFCQSSKARYNEFTTTTMDSPLIVQFAAKNSSEFVDASKLVSPYCDGVDLNCGCPQRWAMKDGYGCALLSQPEVIHSLVRTFKNSLPNNFSVSVKIRLLKDLKETIELCQQLEKCGVSFLTVHARTPSQKSSEDINLDGLKDVHDHIQVPLIANGGVKTLQDADILYDKIKCNGVMAASGILINPALFTGVAKTPKDCVKLWMDIKDRDKEKITFQCYHHHLVFMLEKTLSKDQKQIFNFLNTFETVDDFLLNHIINEDCKPMYIKDEEFLHCYFPESITSRYSKCAVCLRNPNYCTCNKYESESTSGKFFSSYIDNNECNLNFMDSNLFEEY